MAKQNIVVVGDKRTEHLYNIWRLCNKYQTKRIIIYSLYR